MAQVHARSRAQARVRPPPSISDSSSTHSESHLMTPTASETSEASEASEPFEPSNTMPSTKPAQRFIKDFWPFRCTADSIINTQAMEDLTEDFNNICYSEQVPKRMTSTFEACDGAIIMPPKTPADKMRLWRAYTDFGLTSSTIVKDETIADLYNARLQESCIGKQILMDSLTIIAENRDSDFLKGVLDELKAADADADSAGLSMSVKTERPSTIHDKPIAEIFKEAVTAVKLEGGSLGLQYAAQPEHDAVPALHKTIDPAGTDCSVFKGDLITKSGADQLNDVLASVPGDMKDTITINGIQYVKAVQSGPPRPAGACSAEALPAVEVEQDGFDVAESSQDYDQSEDNISLASGELIAGGADGLAGGNGTLHDPWLGHRFSDDVIKVIVGDSSGYYTYTIHDSIMYRLLQDSKFQDQQANIDPDAEIVLDLDISGAHFAEFLNYMYMPNQRVIRHEELNSLLHPAMYALAILFAEPSIAADLRIVVQKTESFDTLLAAAYQVYAYGAADEPFRATFKEQLKQWLNDPDRAWQGTYDENVCLSKVQKIELLKLLNQYPQSNGDVIEVLIDREFDLAMQKVAAESTDIADGVSIDQRYDFDQENCNGEVVGGTHVGYPPSDPQKMRTGYEYEDDNANDHVQPHAPSAVQTGVPGTPAGGTIVFITGLPSDFSHMRLVDYFSWDGVVQSISFPLSMAPENYDWDAQACYVEFRTAEEATKVCYDNKKMFDGRQITLCKSYKGDLEDYRNMLKHSDPVPASGVKAIAIQAGRRPDCNSHFCIGTCFNNVTCLPIAPKVLAKGGAPVAMLGGYSGGGYAQAPKYAEFPMSYVSFDMSGVKDDQDCCACAPKACCAKDDQNNCEWGYSG